MRLLVDTHVPLRWLDGSPRLSPASAEVLVDGANELMMSAATVRESSIEQSSSTLRVAVDPREHALRQGFPELAVTGAHGAAVRELPFHHKDPFERMLIAQARVEGLTFVTADRAMSDYDVPILPATA